MTFRKHVPALALLLGGLAVTSASAEPLLSPLMSESATFATLVSGMPLALPLERGEEVQEWPHRPQFWGSQRLISQRLGVIGGLSDGGGRSNNAPVPPEVGARGTQNEFCASVSSPPRASWDIAQPLRFAAPWMTLRQSDPSLRFASWSQVFNVARLGKFVVPLRSDPAERTNIILAAQAVDGATVAPGAVFSFNQTVGERTPDKGYQDGLMFSEGQLIRGTGGGICIVATGLYNAALHAGMGLLERHPHSGIVGYAPPGCDASIVYGSEDMQFQNTSAAPVVVKTDIRDDCVVVSLYGQTPPPDHKVFVKTTRLDYIHAPIVEQPDSTLASDAKPVVVQKPRLGFDVTIERVITQGDEVLRHETVVSEHRDPRPEILRIPVPAVPAAPVPASTVVPLPVDGEKKSGPDAAFPAPDALHDLYWPFSPAERGVEPKTTPRADAP